MSSLKEHPAHIRDSYARLQYSAIPMLFKPPAARKQKRHVRHPPSRPRRNVAVRRLGGGLVGKPSRHRRSNAIVVHHIGPVSARRCGGPPAGARGWLLVLVLDLVLSSLRPLRPRTEVSAATRVASPQISR